MPKNHDAPTKSDNNSLVDGDFLRNSIEHDVNKQDVAQERAQDLEHRHEDGGQKLESNELKKDLGRMGVLVSNEMAEVGAVKTGFESSDILYGADNDQKYERLESDSIEQLMEKHADFLTFIGESKEFDNKNVEILNNLTDTRKRVEFFHELGLADKLNYFASNPVFNAKLEEFDDFISYCDGLFNNDEALFKEVKDGKIREAFPHEEVFAYIDRNGDMTIKFYDYSYQREREDDTRKNFFRKIAYRESLRQIMIDTPEYTAYKEALDSAGKNSEYFVEYDETMDKVVDHHFCPDNIYSSDSGTTKDIGDWHTIIDAYEMIKGQYTDKHPDLPKEELETRVKQHATEIYKKIFSNNCWPFTYLMRRECMDNIFTRINYVQLSESDQAFLLQKCQSLASDPDEEQIDYYNERMLFVYNLGNFIDVDDANASIASSNEEKTEVMSPLKKAMALHDSSKRRGYDDWMGQIPIDIVEKSYDVYITDGINAAEKMADSLLGDNFYTDKIKQDYNSLYIDKIKQEYKTNKLVGTILGRLIEEVGYEYPGLDGKKDDFLNYMGSNYSECSLIFDERHFNDGVINAIMLTARSYENNECNSVKSVLGVARGIVEAAKFSSRHLAVYCHMCLDADRRQDTDDGTLYRNIKNFYESNDAYRHKWCFDNSYIHLDGGWSKNSIGKIIYNRLETGVESGIHDATYWLESFQIPEEGYDMAALKLAKKQGNDEINPDDFKMKCIDKQEESDFLAQIMSASPEVRSRLKLPNKEQKIQQLFFSPENAAIYQSLLKLYKNEDISYDDLINQVKQERDEFYSEYINNKSGKSSTWRISKDDFNSKVSEVLAKMQETDTNELWTKRVGERMENLYQYGQNREKYIDDATSWLERHSTVANETLTLAFGNRALAIADGEKDSASKLVAWTKLNVIKAISNSKLPENLTKEEVLGKYGNFTKELVRVYPAETTLDALSKYKNIYNPEKIMPANARKLESGGKEYYGEVLSPEDPRGMTIGVDTGCCMTVDGASSTCIKSGYKDKDAGFFALYDGNKKLMAQSYFYINPEQPEVVVMDNIEACQGRDVEKIVDLYKNYFTEYAKEQFGKNPNWQVRQVNIGTGYGEAVKQYVLKLPETEIIKNGHNVYTDADEDQRLLFRLSDKEIEQAKSTRVENTAVDSEKTAKIAPNHDFSIYTDSLSEKQAQIIKEIEAQIYPESMRQYDDEDYLSDEITQPNSEKYSFLIKSEQDASHDTAGYCLAYSAESESDPNYDGKTMYVADFGILPDYRSGPVALKGLEEILKRADSDSIGKIEMDAREATSYKLLTSPWTKRFLKKHGWELTDHGDTVEFDDKEKTILISIDRMSEAA